MSSTNFIDVEQLGDFAEGAISPLIDRVEDLEEVKGGASLTASEIASIINEAKASVTTSGGG